MNRNAELEASWDANQYLSFSISTEYEREAAVVEWVANETIRRSNHQWLLATDDPFFFDRAQASPYSPSIPNRMGDVFATYPNNTFTIKLRYAFTN